ncbi:hypothetical protein PRUPE_8G084400 [Prunus persica]|uniref:Brix domain-containing protein n=1 Tax=Prunus persica TaxID=3760 RepID=A0A251MXA1_PRUPE|nr:hypothetical protein PRUPE_8G084400 [Prunus persica]
MHLSIEISNFNFNSSTIQIQRTNQPFCLHIHPHHHLPASARSCRWRVCTALDKSSIVRRISDISVCWAWFPRPRPLARPTMGSGYKWLSSDPNVISEIIETCRAHDFTDVVLVHENRGVPDGNLYRADLLRRKELGERTANILKHLFPVPKPDTKHIITFTNQSDYISFRHHTYGKHGGPKSIVLEEIGPRFEMRLFKIKLGTLDQTEAQDEWVFKPYMNTAKKYKFIGI